MTYLSKIQANLATNDLGRTAWGVPKVSLDHSIFHGMFTYNIPVTQFIQANPPHPLNIALGYSAHV